MVIAAFSFKQQEGIDIAALRKAYSSGDYSKWPKAILAEAARKNFKDIGPLGDVPFPANNLSVTQKKSWVKCCFLIQGFRCLSK